MLAERIEALVRSAEQVDGEASLSRARSAFEKRTGEFGDSDPFYEERICFFLDWYVCDYRDEAGLTIAERAVLAGESDDAVRGIARSARGLFEVDDIDHEGLTLHDWVGGAEFRVFSSEESASRLRLGDLFDGRVASVGGHVRLMPGTIFHPSEARDAMRALLADARGRGLERAELLDTLLRMRMRLHRFASIKAHHIYDLNAIFEPLATKA